MTGIQPIWNVQTSSSGAGPKGPLQAYGGFSDALRQAVEQVNQLHLSAGTEVESLLTGETEDVHKTILAVQKADLALETLLEVRNKVVQAYQEVMRTQV
ncbi:MAG: flagellar hook-basal body complex protein FliE [Gemmatimonadales bacterium]